MIVDTSVLFAIIYREPERDQLLQQLAAAVGNISMSVATRVEAYVVAQRSCLPGSEEEVGQLIADFGINIVAVSPSAGQIAIDAHRQYGRGSGHPARLNFGDCFAYALAKSSGEPLLFKGNDFAATDIDAVK